MTDTFDFAFGGTRHAPARRWQNPDGSQGGIVAEDAIVDPSTDISRDSIVGPRVIIQEQCMIRGGVYIDRDARIGPDVIIETRVIIGRGATIGAGTGIGFNTIIDGSARIGDGVSIDYNVCIGASARIGDGVCIGSYCCIGEGVYIGKGVYIGEGVSISADVKIEVGDWWITIGPQGRRSAMATAVWAAKKGLRWWVGCNQGISTAELIELVQETHPAGAHHDDYMWMVRFVEDHPGLALARAATHDGHTSGVECAQQDGVVAINKGVVS
jgi:acyl-[acyl carrier protein]--UDP-N-acetylglucosamine O-acyltransferase